MHWSLLCLHSLVHHQVYKRFHSYFHFLMGQILHPIVTLQALKVESSFESWKQFWKHSQVRSIYPLICNLSYIWENYLWLSCIVPTKLLTAPSSVLWLTPTCESFIMLELHYVLALSKRSTTFSKYTSFWYSKVEPLSFWSWIWILFSSKFLETKHG